MPTRPGGGGRERHSSCPHGTFWPTVDRSFDSLKVNVTCVAIGLVIVIGVVNYLIQLNSHRVYFPVVGLASAATIGLWWLVQGRRVWPPLPSKDTLMTFCMVLVAAFCFSDIWFRITNAAFGGSARRVPATVLGSSWIKSRYYLEVSMPEAPSEAELSVSRDTWDKARINQAVVVILHDGLFGDTWCGRDPIEREPAQVPGK